MKRYVSKFNESLDGIAKQVEIEISKFGINPKTIRTITLGIELGLVNSYSNPKYNDIDEVKKKQDIKKYLNMIAKDITDKLN